MSNFTIRLLTEQDAHAYRAIRLEMLLDKPEAYGDSHEESNKESIDFYIYRIVDGQIFAAFDGDNIIATTGYFIQKGQRQDHKAYVWGVYVKPKFRGKNLSSKLLNIVLEDLPSSIILAQLAVVKGNTPAEKIYKKAGFQVWGVEEKALKVGEVFYDEIQMVKFLK